MFYLSIFLNVVLSIPYILLVFYFVRRKAKNKTKEVYQSPYKIDENNINFTEELGELMKLEENEKDTK